MYKTVIRGCLQMRGKASIHYTVNKFKNTSIITITTILIHHYSNIMSVCARLLKIAIKNILIHKIKNVKFKNIVSHVE